VPDGLNVTVIVFTSPNDELCSKFDTRPLKLIFCAPLPLSGKSSKEAVAASPVVKQASINVAVSPEAALS